MAGSVKAKVPFPFVVEALEGLRPEVRRMFSGFAVYVGDRLVLMLRDNVNQARDNGVWLVLAERMDPEEASLRRDFPSLRSIGLLSGAIRHWLVIPSDGEDFEREALLACEFISRGDERIGRVPKSRR